MVRARPLLVVGLALLVGLGAALAGRGVYLGVKAAVAQTLLGHAWDRARRTGDAHRPWPWADTHPVARLHAPTHGIERIVLADSSPRSLAFGPGHVPATALPGEPGPSVISGHRDTHFEFLQALRPGDPLRVERAGATHTYRVIRLRVIDLAHELLAVEMGTERLILVTCYPFDDWTAGGSRRYLVYAHRVSDEAPSSSVPRRTTAGAGVLPLYTAS